MTINSAGSYLKISSALLVIAISILCGVIPTSAATSPEPFNVDNYGARGDGGDDSEAFMKAWEDACSTEGGVLLVPKNRTYHLKPITFSGPCKSGMKMQIYGTIKASVHLSDYEEGERHWIMFEKLNDFTVEGRGRINGNGRKWWQRSCKVNKTMPCKAAPTAVTFYNCNNLRVADVIIQNAQQMHLTFQKCKHVKALNLLVHAPEKSPNTDGIHVTDTENILIENCVIRTGDDCISIVNGSKNVYATDIVCGPGHGISIGSLGADNSADYVSNVLVNRARLSGTTNGLRIKTWQGGSGYAKNIIFQNILMRNVSNPIIIDQNYCDQEEPCEEQASAVQVSNVVYKNIRGTSASEVAVKLDCSETQPCKGIQMRDIGFSLVSGRGSAKSFVANAKFAVNTNVILN
ncbi:polygalacturonase QRT2-like [Punica granatum]|uniref:endo-polygalacturonase n=2 Tax=Punica granatum TaxID=22663 RepID=A0A218X0X9_PUNGR|nr:polygalacturonase QRT2-like [Punica granatum]OWM78379.1 hypothetical protein CDL15_Pgr016103 [Punica granatum]PKI31901.1 hypothetical protein CRG98_047711 [Punica granatum]